VRSNMAKAARDAEARRDEMDDDTVQVATGL
jgi:hypothetical protein